MAFLFMKGLILTKTTATRCGRWGCQSCETQTLGDVRSIISSKEIPKQLVIRKAGRGKFFTQTNIFQDFLLNLQSFLDFECGAGYNLMGSKRLGA